jgi:hypothetical protein
LTKESAALRPRLRPDLQVSRDENSGHQGARREVDDCLSAGYILPEEAAAMRSRAALCLPMAYTQTYRDQYDKFVAIQSCTG